MGKVSQTMKMVLYHLRISLGTQVKGSALKKTIRKGNPNLGYWAEDKSPEKAQSWLKLYDMTMPLPRPLWCLLILHGDTDPI